MDVKIIVPTLPTHGYATVYVYPTISPHIVVIPIVSCIIGFPVFVLLVICALRKRARKARMKAKRRRPIDHTITELVPHTSFNQSRYFNERVIRTKDGKRRTIVRFKPMPELDLDTVVEEKSEFDAEVNVNELLVTQKELSRRIENHSASFRSYRYGYGASGQPLATVKAPSLTSTPSISRSSIDRPTLNTDLDKVDEEEEDNPDLVEGLKEITYHEISQSLTSKTSEVPEVSRTVQHDQSIEKEYSSSNADPATFSPTSHSNSRTSLPESSTTLSSKDFDFLNPSSSSAGNILSVTISPIRCHMIDIGSAKRTPSYINIKGNTVEHIDLAYSQPPFVNKSDFSIIKTSKSCDEIENSMTNPTCCYRTNISDPNKKELNLRAKLSAPYLNELNSRQILGNPFPKEYTILRKFRQNLPEMHNAQDNKKIRRSFSRSDESLVTAIIRKYEGFTANDYIESRKQFPGRGKT